MTITCKIIECTSWMMITHRTISYEAMTFITYVFSILSNLAQRLLRWPNISPALTDHLVSAGQMVDICLTVGHELMWSAVVRVDRNTSIRPPSPGGGGCDMGTQWPGGRGGGGDGFKRFIPDTACICLEVLFYVNFFEILRGPGHTPRIFFNVMHFLHSNVDPGRTAILEVILL